MALGFFDHLPAEDILEIMATLCLVYLGLAGIGAATRRRPRRPLLLLRLSTALAVAVIGLVAWKAPWFELLEGVAMLTVAALVHAFLVARYQAFVDMADYADAHGLQAISLEEHHGAENGWSPSPLIMAGLVFGRTKRIMATLNALLAPLHDPLRLAEDIAVLDLASGGRFIVTAGIGYRESEYEAHGKDWKARGALQDEAPDLVVVRRRLRPHHEHVGDGRV